MGVGSRLAAGRILSCGCILPRDLSRCAGVFLSFLLRGSTRTLHQVSRKARMLACLTFFLPLGVPPSRPFSPFPSFFSPLNPYFSFRTVIFALKHSYVMRRRVIRRVIRTVGPFLIFRTRVPPLALYHVARIIRTIVRRDLSRLRNYFEVTRCYIYHPLHVHFFYDLFYLKKNRT